MYVMSAAYGDMGCSGSGAVPLAAKAFDWKKLKSGAGSTSGGSAVQPYGVPPTATQSTRTPSVCPTFGTITTFSRARPVPWASTPAVRATCVRKHGFVATMGRLARPRSHGWQPAARERRWPIAPSRRSRAREITSMARRRRLHFAGAVPFVW